ncbi:hypothetical protein G4X40_20050 [Rhodococcus sp. D2-41]|uniref:hypothetical protein n=1 Tax=Speluncibacter jeojiensis TaxID=2710754 RepID=UPI002410840E|nr:hypothetical protein [Rhodococcus sp. D2-41]MDG3012437.1 hypothetical protein [Rhodococcus sp. D2-41]
MRALGIAVDPAAGSPKVYVATVELQPSGPVLVDCFIIKTTETEPGAQAVNLARLLQGRLPALSFGAAALKTAGASPVARRSRATFQRAHAEGALLFVLNEVPHVRVEAKDAQGLATLAGKKKDELEAAAVELSVSKYRDAVYAALALLP